jgi:hypothetical protein
MATFFQGAGQHDLTESIQVNFIDNTLQFILTDAALIYFTLKPLHTESLLQWGNTNDRPRTAVPLMTDAIPMILIIF